MSADPQAVAERLAKALPEPECELKHDNGWQLLIATILSAQSTDKTINEITPALFERWPRPQDLAAAAQEEVEEVVRRSGFYRNKAKAIRGTAQAVTERHGGEVPQDFDALTALPGVARKTANLVLGTAYGIQSGMIVDTHAARVSQRLGLTTQKKADKIEKDLCALFDRPSWTDMSHRLILHGRYVCTAKKPACPRCPLNELCPSREADPEGDWSARAAAERTLITAK